MTDLPKDNTGSDPLTFDFITDEGFRTSLESDYQELRKALAADAWKAALVLSGSIIEAILADYLLSTGQKRPDPLRMPLPELITACTEAGVLTERTADLSSVVRSFRNLIHPGRVIRLSETYGEDDANVALHVVRLIVREVAKRQAQEFGLTAEQIVSKFERDHNAPAIAEVLLRDLRSQDLKRLLLDVLPARYFEALEWEFHGSEVFDRFAVLYRAAFDASPDEVKKAAVKRYGEVLRNEAGALVEIYDERFFRGTDTQYMTKANRDLVIAHILARLKAREGAPNLLLAAAPGLSKFLGEAQFQDYIDGFIKIIANDPSADRQEAARASFADEYKVHTNPDQDETIRERLETWITFLLGRDAPEAAARLREIQEDVPAWDDDIPF
jgi:hypothetical protein